MFEFKNGHADFFWLELIENFLRIIGAVIVAHAGVVAADDEMGDAVILADQRVQNGLARAGVTHGQRHHGQHGAVFVVIVVDEHLVALHASIGRNVIGFGLADQRMNQQAVGHLQGALGQIFVRAVDRISRLECGDGLPAALLESFTSFGRRQAIVGKFGLVRGGDHIDRSREASVALLFDDSHARMGFIFRAIDVGNFQSLIVRIFFLNRHQRQ